MRRPLPPISAAAALMMFACQIPYPDAASYRPESLGGDPSLRDRTRLPDSPPTPFLPPADRPLTLEECLRIAEANSRRLRIVDRRILITRDRFDEALSQLLPRLTAEAQYTWRNNDLGVSVMGMDLVMGERTRGNARLGLIVPLYDFGRAQAQMKSETFRAEAAEMDVARSRLELTLAVRLAYFRLLEALHIRDVVRESLRVVDLQAATAKDFLAQGLVARSDVLAAEVQRADRRQNLIRAENNIQLARSTLNRLMGLDVVRPTEVADILEAPPSPPDLETTLKRVIDRRPDLAALKKMIEAGRAEYDLIRRGNLPGIVGTAGYNYTTDEATIHKDWLDAAVILQIPLVDGLGTQFRLKRKTKEIAEAIDLHDERLDDILLEVTQAILQARDAAERLPVARQGVELAEENLRVMRDQYAAGLATTADLLLEEDRLSQARLNRVRALYECHAAAARLENAAGGPLSENHP